MVIEILWGQGEIALAGLLLSFSLFQATPTSLRAILSTDHVPSGWDWAAKVFLKWATCEHLSYSCLIPLLSSFPLNMRSFSFSLYCHRGASVKFIRETETESTAMRPTGFTVSPYIEDNLENRWSASFHFAWSFAASETIAVSDNWLLSQKTDIPVMRFHIMDTSQ